MMVMKVMMNEVMKVLVKVVLNACLTVAVVMKWNDLF